MNQGEYALRTPVRSRRCGPLALVSVLLLARVLAGCSDMDLGVAARSVGWPAEQTAAERSAVSPAQLSRALAAWRARADGPAAEYRLGPEDVITVCVLALYQPEETAEFTRAVSPDGTVSLPWVGGVHVGGLTTAEAEKRIAEAYSRGFLNEPQVSVQVSEYRSRWVLVTGEVAQPGRYPLRGNGSTVLECLAEAGGLARAAGGELVLIRAGEARERTVANGADGGSPASQALSGPVAKVDLDRLLGQGDMSLNLPVHDGDVLTVPARTEQYVYVLGYVRKPGPYPIRRSRMDVLAALACGGGLSQLGRSDKVYLVRRTADGLQTRRVDVPAMTRGEVPPTYLQDGDTLVVSTSTMGRISEFFRPTAGASANVTANAAVTP